MEAVQKMEDSQEINEGLSLPMENSHPSDASKNCNLCGSSAPAVRCDKCGSQTFCLSCDDMYHRHPKRRFHLRKAVDSIWNSHRSPRFRRRTELPGDPSKIPVPPPRTKKQRHSSDFGNMFRPNFQIPGFKGFFAQNKPADTKNQEPSDKSISPVSPDLNYENSVGNGLHTPVDEDKDKSLPRRSSADNFSASTTSPVNLGVSPMQVDSEDRNNPGISPHFLGHFGPHGNVDLNAATAQPIPPMYPFPPHMHPFYPPHLNPYPTAMTPFNCPQCLHASWSNLMSTGMAQFHQHHHIPTSVGTATTPRTGTLKTRSPSPESLMRQSQSAAYQSFLTSSPPVAQTTSAAAASPAPDIVQHSSPALPQFEEAENAAVKEGQQAQLQHILASEEEMEEDETVEGGEEDAEPKIPEKPTEPWECVHCTFINPPGSHVCDVCCKTSYNVAASNKKGSKRKRDKHQEATGTSDSASAVASGSKVSADAEKVTKL